MTSSRVGAGVAVEQRLGRHQHAGRAIAALGGEVVHERLLQRVAGWPLWRARGRAHRPALYGFGQRQAGEVQLAVDGDGAGAAGALAAAVFGREVADPAAQEVEQVRTLVGEGRARAAVEGEADGFFAISPGPCVRAGAEMHAQRPRAVPGAGERVGRRVEPFGGHRSGPGDGGGVEAWPSSARSIQPSAEDAGPWRRGHAGAADAPPRAAGGRRWTGPRRPWAAPADLQKAEAARVARPGQLDGGHEAGAARSRRGPRVGGGCPALP
jgi:hypothetical protein